VLTFQNCPDHSFLVSVLYVSGAPQATYHFPNHAFFGGGADFGDDRLPDHEIGQFHPALLSDFKPALSQSLRDALDKLIRLASRSSRKRPQHAGVGPDEFGREVNRVQSDSIAATLSRTGHCAFPPIGGA